MSAYVMATAWLLNELMARHRVTGVALGKKLGMTANGVSKLRNHKTMPTINGDRLDEIAAALTELSEIGEGVLGVDLIENREMRK